MRNNKLVAFFVLSVLTVLVFLGVWHQETIKPIILGLTNNEPEVTAPKTPKPLSESFIKTVGDYDYLGYQKTVYTKPEFDSVNKNSVLVISSIANENSFGKGRLFEDFYDLIGSLEYPKSQLNLSIYCGSEALLKLVSDFFEVVTKTAKCPYNKVTILYASFLQTNFKSSEHNPKVQRQRRRSIARGRNFVLFNSLESEQYTLFLDADITRFEHPDMLDRFVKSEKDIIVPRIERGGSLDYDRNSWYGQRIKPTENQLKLMDEDKWEEADFVPMDVDGQMYHLGDHVSAIKGLPETDEKRDLSYAVPLDSVGGAVLFSKSIIYKQGVVFPTMNVVGTTWDRSEGYDGIETEGVCYMAQTMGYKCYGMPNLVTQHFFSK